MQAEWLVTYAVGTGTEYAIGLSSQCQADGAIPTGQESDKTAGCWSLVFVNYRVIFGAVMYRGDWSKSRKV